MRQPIGPRACLLIPSIDLWFHGHCYLSFVGDPLCYQKGMLYRIVIFVLKLDHSRNRGKKTKGSRRLMPNGEAKALSDLFTFAPALSVVHYLLHTTFCNTLMARKFIMITYVRV